MTPEEISEVGHRLCPYCGNGIYSEDDRVYSCGTLVGATAPETGLCHSGYEHQLKTELADLKSLVWETEIESFNEGIEMAAQIFDKKEVFHYQGATWDRTQIVQGSKYNVPTNGPAIVCTGAEKQAKEIRALKRPRPEVKAIMEGK